MSGSRRGFCRSPRGGRRSSGGFCDSRLGREEWFRRFTTRPDTEGAFAAFRLFLRCVDRRYWVWRGRIVEDARLSAVRRRYLAVSRDEIERAIKENEKDLEKRFLGTEIPENSVHPWLKRYLG